MTGISIPIEDMIADGVRLPLTEPECGSITRIRIGRDGAWKLRTSNEINHIEPLTGYQEERNEFSR